jgi:uncharacterized protein (TIGR00369 family)
MPFEPRNSDYEDKIRRSFAQQTTMTTMGMELHDIVPGQVEIMLTKHDGIVQQMGFVHGGVLTSGLDSSCGYAALTLAPAENEVMTVELKTSFFAPAGQEKILFVGTVLKPGRRAIFTEGEAIGLDGDDRILLAKMSATMTYIDMP